MDTAGLGKGGGSEQSEAKIMLDEEEFRRGVSVEEFGAESKKEVMGEEKRSLKAEEVKRILFDGKTFDSEQGEFPLTFSRLRSTLLMATVVSDRSNYSEQTLGTFSLLLPTKRPFSASSSLLSTIPPYSTSVPPSSIRTPSTPQAGSTPSAPMQGFGSDSVRSISSNDFRRGPPTSSSSRRDKVVLVPTSSGSRDRDDIYRGSSSNGGQRGKNKEVDLEDFYKDEESSEEEDDEEEEEVSEEEEESEEEESEEGESEQESSGEEESEEEKGQNGNKR